MIEEISIEEFRRTGMLVYINQVMQPFGLSIAVQDGDKLIPIKTKFRGFGPEQIDKCYQNLNQYLKKNIEEITDIDEEN